MNSPVCTLKYAAMGPLQKQTRSPPVLDHIHIHTSLIPFEERMDTISLPFSGARPLLLFPKLEDVLISLNVCGPVQGI